MARKEPPPAASSTSSSSSSDEEPEPQHQGDSSSSSSSGEEEAAPLSPLKKCSTLKKPNPSDSETDSDEPPAKVKPIESKPMDLKKPRSKPSSSTTPVTVLASPAVSSSKLKRRGGSDAKEKVTVKPKKAKIEKVEGSQDDSKKPLFQRLWSEDDEIVILEGMIEYKAKKCIDPMGDADGFLEFIKKSLHVDVNRAQIMSKVRTLRKRFENAKKKKKIVDPHGVKLFELSKKIWENDGVKSNGKDTNMKAKPKKETSVEKMKDVNGLVSEKQKEEEDEDEEEEDEKLQDWVISRREKEELKLEDLGNSEFLKDGFLKEGINLLDEGEKAKIAEKWKKHNLVEMELYLKRLDLLKELTQKTLNAINSA